MRARFIGWLLVVILTAIPLAQAQDAVIEPASDEEVNPQANISFPPPVYVVRDSVEIRGTVTLDNLRNFFIQFRQLVLDETESDEEAPWFPATVHHTQPVTDDVLGLWNTFTAEDGLYELRLTVNTDSETPEYVRISPIRVENNVPEFLQTDDETETAEAAESDEPSEAEADPEEADPEEAEPDPPEATPTPEDTTPRVTAQYESNVRAGDSTQHHIAGFLATGQEARILGISSRGTGWYYIELPNGRTGFIHPGIVTAAGDLSNLRRIQPPPAPLPTPVPIIPTAAPAAQPPQPAPASSSANLVMENNVVINPHPAVCGEAYRIEVTVRNIGSAATTSGGIIRVTDTRHDGAQPASTDIAFGALAAGGTQRVFGHLTTSTYYNERHNINLRLDANNQVPESNENDNLHATAPYILQRGNC